MKKQIENHTTPHCNKHKYLCTTAQYGIYYERVTLYTIIKE